MKNILQSQLLTQLGKRGFIIQRIARKERVIKLIESLHPFKTHLELVRIGPNGDGGYLLPNDLDGIEACFSPGVDKISEFELECFNFGMKIFMADKSVDKPNLNIPESKYSFQKKFIGSTNNEEFMTMDSWVESSDLHNDSELLLQMDIEGGEYNSIINMSESLINRFRIIVIEFHFLAHLWDRRFIDFAELAFEKILQTHVCVHIHPNNADHIDSRLGITIPNVSEFTFIRKDRVKLESYQTQFPHSLDFDNSNNKHVPLPKDWYKS